jgi:tripartite-type tricarboxylate transporter receptor subunit TctC
MKAQHVITAALATTLMLVGSAVAQGQPFPAKPVRVVLPYSAGSGPDTVMRLVRDKLAVSWGQQLIVENRPGGNGWIAIGAAQQAPADGYTLLAVDDTHMALQPHIFNKLPHDPARDFEAVSPLYRTYFFVVVPVNSPWKSVTDLIVDAKAKPNGLTYGTWGIGSVAHIGAATLEAATGTKMTHVPFKELPALYGAVANGDLSWAFGTAATAGPLYKGAKVRFLAYAAPRRLAGYADIPTVTEANGPANFELKTWVGLLAPRGTPKPIIEKINADVAKALADPVIRERLAVVGFEPYAVSPAEMSELIANDSRRYAEISKRAKISIE